MPFNLPIALTWLRIALIPFFVGLFYIPESILSVAVRDALAAWLFVLAALTDWFDGAFGGIVYHRMPFSSI